MPHVKWILPHAPRQSVTANFGMIMPSWFDIKDFSFNSEEDERGMLTSVRMIEGIIRQEVDGGVDASRVVLGGFSQGGVTSLLGGLTSERKLGGVVVLSGWLPLRAKFKAVSEIVKPSSWCQLSEAKCFQMMSGHAKSLPIFWGHGTADPIVRFEFAKRSVEYLVGTCGLTRLDRDKIGSPGLTFVEYRGVEHSSCQEELNDLGEFLRRVVPESP